MMFIAHTTIALRSFFPKNHTTSNAHITGGATWPNDHRIHLRNATFFTNLSSQPVNLEIRFPGHLRQRISGF